MSSFLWADDGIWFGVVVGVEIALCLAGSVILAARKHGGLIAPRISLVLGLHFIPLPSAITGLINASVLLLTAGVNLIPGLI